MEFECPKCKSQLKYWNEFIFTRERTSNKHTGELNKKVSKSREIESENHGLECTNKSCRFQYYGNFHANEKDYEHLDSILENYTIIK